MKLKKIQKQLGLKISTLRRNKKMTSEKLAYETGISKGYLSDIENGKKLPSIKILAELGDTLGVKLKDFF